MAPQVLDEDSSDLGVEATSEGLEDAVEEALDVADSMEDEESDINSE